MEFNLIHELNLHPNAKSLYVLCNETKNTFRFFIKYSSMRLAVSVNVFYLI
jgi:hypothetical protein